MLIFTDLDATLLDHETYSFEDAAPMLGELARRGIPVIPATSKTRAEVLVWRERLGLAGPYITENGAGVFVPPALAAPLGLVAPLDGGDACLGQSMTYTEVRTIFRELARQLPIVGFGDMTLAEIAAHTGLTEESSELARRREFSEPFLLHDPAALTVLEQRVSAHGLHLLRGGRFLHLLDARASKGAALRVIRAAYEQLRRSRPRTLALGDSPNDLEMLRTADRGIVVPGRSGVAPGMDLTGLDVAPYPGPRGWAEAVRRVVG